MAEQSELIQAYLARAEKSLTAAELLLNSSLFDDAVSRAYYAMFYAAKAALETIGIETNSHSGLISQFGLHFIKTGKLQSRYGRMLAQTFQVRQVGDLDVQVSPRPIEAEKVVSDAVQFVAVIKKLLSESNESQ